MRRLLPLAALLWPGVCLAEVGDKIPTQAHLDAVLFAHLALAGLAVFLPKRPYAQLAVAIVLILHGALYASELLLGDVGSAVRTEMGAAYVLTVILLLGGPVAVTCAGLLARRSRWGVGGRVIHPR